MTRQFPNDKWLTAVTLAAILVLTACAASKSAPNDQPEPGIAREVQSLITPMVETLYLNTRELIETYRDLRAVARAHAFRADDDQLNYVQKIALYVLKSHDSSYHQWEFLSLMHDIRPSATMDYFTLRHKGLHKAAREALDDERFIEIYQSKITHPAANTDIDRALTIIRANRKILLNIAAAIAPMVHRRATGENV